jgi:hypothetical protein
MGEAASGRRQRGCETSTNVHLVGETMKSNTTIGLLLLVLLFHSAGNGEGLVTSDPEKPTGRISGVVIDSQSSLPVGAARIEWTQDLIFPGGAVHTNRNGEFAIGNLAAGTYDLYVLQEGFVPKIVFGVKMEEGKETATVKAAVLPTKLLRRMGLGDEARDFTLRTIEGDRVSLSSFRGKKIVVLCIGNPYG